MLSRYALLLVPCFSQVILEAYTLPPQHFRPVLRAPSTGTPKETYELSSWMRPDSMMRSNSRKDAHIRPLTTPQHLITTANLQRSEEHPASATNRAPQAPWDFYNPLYQGPLLQSYLHTPPQSLGPLQTPSNAIPGAIPGNLGNLGTDYELSPLCAKIIETASLRKLE